MKDLSGSMSMIGEQEAAPAGRWRKVLAAAFLLGILLRLAFITLPGTGDMIYFKGWSLAAADFGVVNVYPPFPSEIAYALSRFYHLPVNYPPITAHYLGVVGEVYRHLPHHFQTAGLHNALVKAPVIMLEFLAACLLYRFVARKRDVRSGVIAFSCYWLNPVFILGGAVMGYQDGVAIGLSLMSLLFALESRIILSCAMLSAALLAKQLALFIVPVLALYLVLASCRRKVFFGFVAAAAVCCVVLAPYLAIDGRVAEVYRYLADVSVHSYISANALNVWWIYTSLIQVFEQWSAGGQFLEQVMGVKLVYLVTTSPAVHTVARVAYVGFTVLNLAFLTSRRNSAGAYLYAAFMQFYGYFMLMTGVHENHLLYAPLFLVPLLFTAGSMRYMYGAVSTVAFANLFLFYGPTGDQAIRGMGAYSLLTFLFSIANLALFAWAVVILVRGTYMTAGRDDTVPGTQHPLLRLPFWRSA